MVRTVRSVLFVAAQSQNENVPKTNSIVFVPKEYKCVYDEAPHIYKHFIYIYTMLIHN